MRKSVICITGSILLTLPSTSAQADDAAPSSPVTDYQIVAPKLEESRSAIDSANGSSSYSFDQNAITALPQGDNSQVSDVLLRAPGVAQDSYGQLHVRGDHGDLQYRINGIILPEGITGFGETLDTHFADSINLLTGALPAEYGYRTAGVVDITTKSGAEQNGGRSTVEVGSSQTVQGNQQLYGSRGPFSYYFSGTYDQNDRGVEPPTASAATIHDFTQQDKEFGYMSYTLNAENKLSVIFGNATSRFEVPNNPGQTPALTQAGSPIPPSAALDERQYEHNTYAIGALQGVIGDQTDYQFALYSRDSTVLFKPDPLGDLLYNGIASRVDQESVTNGAQGDFTYRLNEAHTIRTGFTGSYEQATSNTAASVFPLSACDAAGSCAGPAETLTDDHTKGATLLGYYLQDEWKAFDKLTLNYGARFDYYDAYISDSQLSPRIGAIYDLTPTTKLHAGYARYFTLPPTELIAPLTVAEFTGTTGAPPGSGSSSVHPETDNYYDAGITQAIGKHLTLGADAYYKQARNLLDEGQFGSALIFAPFNYAKGFARGIEFTADYHNGPFSAYANTAISQAMGKDVVSGQYNFSPDELAYIADNRVHLDHDQTYTGSAGSTYTFRSVTYAADLIYGSGLRDGFANTDHLPFYTQVNASAAHTFNLGEAGKLDAKFSIINLFDKVYEIRDGSGIGVFAPQYGPRRTLFLSLSKTF